MDVPDVRHRPGSRRSSGNHVNKEAMLGDPSCKGETNQQAERRNCAGICSVGSGRRGPGAEQLWRKLPEHFSLFNPGLLTFSSYLTEVPPPNEGEIRSYVPSY